MNKVLIVLLAAVIQGHLLYGQDIAKGAETAATRAAFLRLLDRPRVPLAAEYQAAAAANGLVTAQFSFAAEASQRVPGLLVRPAGAPGRRPVVVVLHGTGGNKESQVGLLKTLAGKGFAAVAIDGRYHGARTAGGKGTKEYHEAILRAYHTGKEHPFFYDTAWDVMRLVDYLETREDVDAKRIGLIGFSKGGIETYLSAAADPRIAVAVPCIGVQSFRWALEHDSWQSRVGTIQPAVDAAAKEAGVAVDAAFVQKFYDRIAPEIYGKFDGPSMLTLIAPRPLLAINGDTDARTPMPGLQLCAEAARAAYQQQHAAEKFVLRVQENTGHKVTPQAQQEAVEWFVKWLKP
jgi:dienelactone hydrolase